VAYCQAGKDYYALTREEEEYSRRFIWWRWGVSADLDSETLDTHDGNLERVFPSKLHA